MNVSRRVHRSDSLQDNRRLRAQLSAERGQLLRAAAAHVFSCGAVACCFWAQQGAAPGFPGPFWATCEITPVSRHDPWVSGYLGCISVPIMWSFLMQLVGGVSAVATALYVISSAVRLARLSKIPGGAGNARRDYALPAMAALALVHVMAATLAALAWSCLMKPGETWQTDPDGNPRATGEWTNDSWYVFIGGLMFAACAPLTVAICVIERTLCCPKLCACPSAARSSASALSSSDVPLLEAGDVGAGDEKGASVDRLDSALPLPQLRTTTLAGWQSCRCGSLTAAVLTLLACFAATTLLSPIWNLSASSYNLARSEYSWVDWPLFGNLPCFDAKEKTCDQAWRCGDYDCSWASIKIYTDTATYYAVLLCGVCLGAAFHAFRCKWRRLPAPPKPLSTLFGCFPRGCTALEAVAVAAAGSLFLFWFIYWASLYKRIADDENTNDCWLGAGNYTVLAYNTYCTTAAASVPTGYGWLHVLGRATGHMASLSFALTLLPVAKCNVLLDAVGLGWEEVLHWHRGLGAVSYLAMTLHMAVWWIKWSLEGTFWLNLFPPNSNAWLWITPTVNHFENFTIVMSHVSWILLTGTLVVAWWGRRKMYRLFYLIHQLTLVTLLVGLVHAWSFWYFAAPGLCMWWVDRLLRACREAEALTCREATAIEGPRVTHLRIYSPTLAARFQPGQYAWIVVPSISATAAHPFTANVTDDSHVSFLCKDMTLAPAQPASHDDDDGTTTQPHNWTRRLYDAVIAGNKNAGAGAASAVTGNVTVVGFYGGVLSASFTNTPVVLVAGGIGITPVISVFQAALKARARDVTLVWVIRRSTMLELPVVSQVLEDFAGGEYAATVDVIVHVTRGKVEEAVLPAWAALEGEGGTSGAEAKGSGGASFGSPSGGRHVRVKKGRPNLRQVFEEVVQRNTAAGGQQRSCLAPGAGFTFACGPSQLQDSVSELSTMFGFHGNHTETFLF
jgi:predicted ferric reductase